MQIRPFQNAIRSFGIPELTKRSQATTPEIRDEFMRPRQLTFTGMPSEKDQVPSLSAEVKQLKDELAKLRAGSAAP